MQTSSVGLGDEIREKGGGVRGKSKSCGLVSDSEWSVNECTNNRDNYEG